MFHLKDKLENTAIVSIIDKGIGILAAKDVIKTAQPYIDIVKLAFGTALLYNPSVLKEKIKIYQEANIKVCFGGTLFEYFVLRDKVKDYYDLCKQFSVNLVEISDGTIEMPHDKKLNYIREAVSLGFIAISEVGKKFDLDDTASSEETAEMVESELMAGSWKVILEARESGNTGIYSQDGNPKEEKLSGILGSVNIEDVIFEAPMSSQQKYFICKFGAGVNLGNIAFDDVFSVASLRYGLRADTLLCDFVHS